MKLTQFLYYCGTAIFGLAVSISIFHLGELDIPFAGADKIYAKTPQGQKFLLPFGSTVRHWSPGGSGFIGAIVKNDDDKLELTPHDGGGFFSSSHSYYAEGYDVKYDTGDGLFILVANDKYRHGIEPHFRTPDGNCTAIGELAFQNFIATLAHQRKEKK